MRIVITKKNKEMYFLPSIYSERLFQRELKSILEKTCNKDARMVMVNLDPDYHQSRSVTINCDEIETIEARDN